MGLNKETLVENMEGRIGDFFMKGYFKDMLQMLYLSCPRDVIKLPSHLFLQREPTELSEVYQNLEAAVKEIHKCPQRQGKGSSLSP